MSQPTMTADEPADRVTSEASGGVVPRWPGAAPAVATSSLVGRDRDLAALRSLIQGPETAFVTLVGVGGVGKSRLAAELAVQDLPAYSGRVASVPLDAVSDAELVLPALAGALGIGDEPGSSVAEALADAL